MAARTNGVLPPRRPNLKGYKHYQYVCSGYQMFIATKDPLSYVAPSISIGNNHEFHFQASPNFKAYITIIDTNDPSKPPMHVDLREKSVKIDPPYTSTPMKRFKRAPPQAKRFRRAPPQEMPPPMSPVSEAESGYASDISEVSE